MNEYFDNRVVTMFVGKISSFNYDIQNQFAIRNRSSDPDLTKQIVQKSIRDLRLWRHLLSKLNNDLKTKIQYELNKLQIK